MERRGRLNGGEVAVLAMTEAIGRLGRAAARRPDLMRAYREENGHE